MKKETGLAVMAGCTEDNEAFGNTETAVENLHKNVNQPIFVYCTNHTIH